jgi:hypothetical protein
MLQMLLAFSERYVSLPTDPAMLALALIFVAFGDRNQILRNLRN